MPQKTALSLNKIARLTLDCNKRYRLLVDLVSDLIVVNCASFFAIVI